MDRIVSTSKMIGTYLQENSITLEQLADASGVSIITIQRLFNEESKLPYDVAKGVNALIPEIGVEFLMNYDVKYQSQKRIGMQIK